MIGRETLDPIAAEQGGQNTTSARTIAEWYTSNDPG